MDDVADLYSNLESADTDLGTLIEEELGKVKFVELADVDPNLDTNDSVGKSGALINEEKGNAKLVKSPIGEVLGADVADMNPKLKKIGSLEKLGGFGTLIEENMGRNKIASLADVDSVKSEKVESGGSSFDSESESQSDSSSSSEDEEDEKEDCEMSDSDVEKMVAWSEDEFDDENGGVSKGPIKSRNELKDLPAVPPVEARLEPHHHTVPVGVISSIIGAQVIVEGVEQHNPLNEGTIFWITDSRSPLGIVDEIFGPVKGPYYIIRYNSENEIPEGIKQGTSISFVPEFANHVLKDNLYKKGYDASGDNDEEVSDDYEFSDDEKEAEYRKLQKMKKKRGTNEATNRGNEFKERKNFKNRSGGGFVQNNDAPKGGANQVATPPCNQQYASPVATSADNGIYTNSFSVVGQNQGNNAPSCIPQFQQTVPQFQQTVPIMGFFPPPNNAVWANGMPGQQQGGMVFPNGMMWQQQNMLPNGVGVPFTQQYAPNQNFPFNGVLPGVQPNFSGSPSFGPWPGPFVQSGPLNMNGQQYPPSTVNTEMHGEFNQGAYQSGSSSSRGRGQHHRGGGRFRGGRER